MPIDADDYRHQLDDRPAARESVCYRLAVPEEGISGFFSTWVDAKDKAGFLVALYTDKAEPLVFDQHDRLSARKRDFDDWGVGGLHLRHTKALEAAEVTYTGEKSMVELRFTALHRAFSYKENANGCPAWLADDRLEQSGTVEGRLVVGGRRVDFNATAHRTHWWGGRDWDSAHHWKWISGQAGSHLSFNVMQSLALGRVWTNGYVNRGGNVWPLTSVDVEVGLDNAFEPTRLGVALRAQDGHAVEAQAERFALVALPAGAGLVTQEAGCTGQAGGRDALVHLEMGWPKSYLAHQVERSQG